MESYTLEKIVLSELDKEALYNIQSITILYEKSNELKEISFPFSSEDYYSDYRAYLKHVLFYNEDFDFRIITVNEIAYITTINPNIKIIEVTADDNDFNPEIKDIIIPHNYIEDLQLKEDTGTGLKYNITFKNRIDAYSLQHNAYFLPKRRNFDIELKYNQFKDVVFYMDKYNGSIIEFKESFYSHKKYSSKLFTYKQKNKKVYIEQILPTKDEVPFPKYKVTYSTDGVNYTENNTFKLPVGKHTIYIKNQIGQIVTKEVQIFDFEAKKPIAPYFFISKINPIRYAKLVKHDNIEIYKTDENTISCNDLDALNHRAVQLWQQDDKIKTQLKTNYTSVTAQAFNKNKTIDLNPKLIHKFTNVYDVRTANIYTYNDDFLAVYFKKGQILHDDNSSEEYNAYGVVPYFYKAKTQVQINDAEYHNITKIAFDKEKQVEILLIPNTINITEKEQITLKYNYDIHPYNVWEFEVPMHEFLNQKFSIAITADSLYFDKMYYLSEYQSVSPVQEDCIELIYFDTDNSEFMYETGIQNKLRLKIERQKDISKSDTNIHITDTKAILLNSSYYEAKEFIFSLLTSEIAKTLELALIHEHVYINRVRYVAKEQPKKEQQENTNLYEVTATMLKAGESHVFQFGDTTTQADIEQQNTNIDIPNLINNAEDGFIAY